MMVTAGKRRRTTQGGAGETERRQVRTGRKGIVTERKVRCQSAESTGVGKMTQVADLAYPPDARNNKLGVSLRIERGDKGERLTAAGIWPRLRKQIISLVGGRKSNRRRCNRGCTPP
jgi:hypothetical protein